MNRTTWTWALLVALSSLTISAGQEGELPPGWEDGPPPAWEDGPPPPPPGWDEGDGPPPPPPPPRPARDLLAEALTALDFDAETEAVVRPLLEAVLAARREQSSTERRLRGELLERVRAPASAEALQRTLDGHRRGLAEARARTAKAQAELVQVLSIPQEVELVLLGILE